MPLLPPRTLLLYLLPKKPHNLPTGSDPVVGLTLKKLLAFRKVQVGPDKGKSKHRDSRCPNIKCSWK